MIYRNCPETAIRCSRQRLNGARGDLALSCIRSELDIFGERRVLIFLMGGLNLRTILAHLAQSGRTLEEYKQSIHDINNIIDSRKPCFHTVIGIDVQGGSFGNATS